MSKEMLVIALGVWTSVLTQLGIPGSWKLALLFLTGIAIALLGFLLRGEALSRGTNGARSASFVESTGPKHHDEEGIGSLN